MKGFTFYNNYYELIKYLPDEDRHKMYDAIFQYMFEDVEPDFEGLLKGLWINIKMPLNTSKNNSGRGGRKNRNETDKKPIKNRIKTEKETNNNISYFLFLISNNKYKYINKDEEIYKTITEWLEYKEQRKELYKEKGLESLLTQIDKQCELHGEDNVVNLINECMASNYKGIIFDKIKNVKSNPDWMNKKVEKQKLTDREEEELERILEDFK